jgi:hypothetical protein
VSNQHLLIQEFPDVRETARFSTDRYLTCPKHTSGISIFSEVLS